MLFIIFKHKLQGIGSRSENYCQFNKKLSCRKEAVQCSVSLKIYLPLSHSKSFEFTSLNMACVSSYSSSIVTMAISSLSLIDYKSDKSRRQTELLWFGSTMNLRRLPADTSIRINNCVIQPATVVRDLDVWIDSELSRREHVSCGLLRYVFSTCAVYALFVENSAATCLRDWSRPLCCHASTTATPSSSTSRRRHWHHAESCTRRRDSCSA